MSAPGQNRPAKRLDINRLERNPEDSPHRCLDHLGIIQFHRIGRSEHPIETEPVRDPQDRSQVAGIPDTIERQPKALVQLRETGRGKRLTDNGQYRGRGALGGYLRHRLFSNYFPAVDLHNFEAGSDRLGNHFLSLDRKQTGFIPEFLLGEGTDLPQLVLGNAHGCKDIIFLAEIHGKSVNFVGMNRGKTILVLLAGILAVSCSTTRVLREGQYRLAGSKIVIENRLVPGAELSSYVSQKPNSSLLGLSPALSIYNWADTADTWINNMIRKYGALDPIFGHTEYAQIPMAVVGIVMKFFQIVISIVVGMAAGCIPIVGYNMGAGRKDRARELFTKLLKAEAFVGAVALLIVELMPGQLIAIFGAANESVYYTDFAVKSFRIYLSMMVLACVNKATFIYLQSLGKAVESTLLSLVRELVFGVGFALILPLFFGLDGVLYSMPVSDVLTFILSVVIIVRCYKELGIANNQEK